MNTKNWKLKIPLEKLDDALMLWFTQERNKWKPVSGPTLKEKAVQLRLKMGGHARWLKASEKAGLADGRKEMEFIWSRFRGKNYHTILKPKRCLKINSRFLLKKKVYLTISFIMWMKLVYIFDCFHTKH